MYAGTHAIEFDGKGDNRQALPTGVYFYRLTTNLGSLSRKMVLLK
jgi:flagellar hook assembly protein FlgD